MHVSLEHTQEGKAYYLVASVTFSEVEKHIIQTRKLEALPIIEGRDAPMPGFWQEMAPGAGAFGPILMIAGFVIGLMGSAWGGFLFFVGLILWGWLYFGDARLAMKKMVTTHTVGSVLRKPSIKLVSDDPLGTKAYEHQLRENLQNVKRYIEANETLGEKQSFDI